MKPISIILTTLAARAYQGEVFLSDALTGILSRMGEYVKDAEPRIANPVNPKEDFADRWKDDDRLESCFWAWLKQAQYDFANLGKLDNPVLIEGLIDERFGTKVESSKIRNFLPIGAASTVAQSVTVSAGASSWSENG